MSFGVVTCSLAPLFYHPFCKQLFTKCSQGFKLGATKNESSEYQQGGLEPKTTRLQVQRPNHSASCKYPKYQATKLLITTAYKSTMQVCSKFVRELFLEWYTKQDRSVKLSIQSNSWLMSYVIDGVLGLDFLRYSSNILQTPERYS